MLFDRCPKEVKEEYGEQYVEDGNSDIESFLVDIYYTYSCSVFIKVKQLQYFSFKRKWVKSSIKVFRHIYLPSQLLLIIKLIRDIYIWCGRYSSSLSMPVGAFLIYKILTSLLVIWFRNPHTCHTISYVFNLYIILIMPYLTWLNHGKWQGVQFVNCM